MHAYADQLAFKATVDDDSEVIITYVDKQTKVLSHGALSIQTMWLSNKLLTSLSQKLRTHLIQALKQQLTSSSSQTPFLHFKNLRVYKH